MVTWSRGEQIYHDVEQLALQVMVLKESKTHANLAFAKHKAICSLLTRSTFSHLPLPYKPTHQHPAPRGPLDMQHGKAKLGGAHGLIFTEGILLQQPKLLAATPGFTCRSLDMLKKSPAPSHLLRGHPHHSQDKKPSSTPTHGLKMSPEKWQPKAASSCATAWPPLAETSAMGSQPAAGALGVLCSSAIPREPWHIFTWPFPFTGIQGGTAVLSVRKGRMIKPAKQHSKSDTSSAPASALSTELLFRNFTKRKSESYFGCMAKKLPPFQRN